MQTRTRTTFTTVKTEGALLPADLLQRIAAGKAEGLLPQDYHLAPGERINEAINRAWNRLLGVWQGFDEQRRRLDATETGVTLTRERWLLILFQELGYGRLTFQRSLELADGKSYPISHLWVQTPIHLVSFKQELDKPDPTARRSPHSLLQEFLNRSDGHLWGFVSNGLALRLLRDNASLTRAAYVEFDLEQMMTGEHYADFSLLWLVCHQSRVEGEGSSELGVGSGGEDGDDDSTPDSPLPTPQSCWLERWSQGAVEEGTRALDDLRTGVQEAIAALGRGFVRHRANDSLRAALQRGDLSTQDYYRQLLRLVYRCIFLFVAEDRELLLLPGTPQPVREKYSRFYSLGRLRGLAENRRGGPHPDLYRSLSLLCRQLGQGFAPLGLPGLGSFLFSERATPHLDGAELANSDLLEAIRALAFTQTGNVRRAVDYRNLGTEELGSVYESLLELHPHLNVAAGSFELEAAAGSERKTTGSYYTPASLINALLESALEPVVAARLGDATDAEEALLSIKVVDPACGSGHFLIAAANRLALHLARIRTGDDEPGPGARRRAVRDVIHHCIYGVDINPMSVELCKVALWMESLEPGRPLGFLDRNIQCGNSLLGATPALLRRGIPDDAFKPILGDDREYAALFRKQNREERKGQLGFDRASLYPWERLGNLAESLRQLEGMDDSTVEGVRRQEERYAQLVASSDYRFGRLYADAWAAAFVWVKREGSRESGVGNRESGSLRPTAHSPLPTPGFSYPITQQTLREIERNPHTCPAWMAAEIQRLAEQYQFFHWHLAFPQIFQPVDDQKRSRTFVKSPTSEDDDGDVTGWSGGFDVVLGNPPWERVQTEEKQFFADVRPEIASARSRERKQMIADLESEDPVLYEQWRNAERTSLGESHFIRNSGAFPLSGSGNINTFAVFAELSLSRLNTRGRLGTIVPSSIITEVSNKLLFQAWMFRRQLVYAFDFENSRKIFAGVHSSFRFALLIFDLENTQSDKCQFMFFLRSASEVRDEERQLSFDIDDIAILNPNSLTCPPLRSRRDAALLLAMQRAAAPFLLESAMSKNDWLAESRQMLNTSHDSELFIEPTEIIEDRMNLFGISVSQEQRLLRLYDGKMIDQYNHRFASTGYARESTFRTTSSEATSDIQYQSPAYLIRPQYWIKQESVRSRQPEYYHHRDWMIGIRAITASTNWRTVIGAFVPLSGMTHALRTLYSEMPANLLCVLLSMFNSHVVDYAARLKISGTNLTAAILNQLPVLPPSTIASHDLSTALSYFPDTCVRAVVELTYTAYDLRPFARDCGYAGPPFRWDEERRFLLRCELDAAYFHLYGIEREDVAYILDTFPIVKRKDIAAHGEYRTARVILEIYDEMAAAIAGGAAYRTRLDPPPAHPAAAHPWDEAYLGPRLPEDEWWEEVAGGKWQVAGGGDSTTPEDQRRSSDALSLSKGSRVFEAYRDQAGEVAGGRSQVAGGDASTTDDGRRTARVSETEAGYEASEKGVGNRESGVGGNPTPHSLLPTTPIPPPTGSYQERLRRVLALAKASNDGDLRELAAFLADEDGQIRWLAAGTVARVGGPAMVAVLADFIAAAEPERVARARPEMVRALRTIAESGEGAVAEGARGVLSQIERPDS